MVGLDGVGEDSEGLQRIVRQREVQLTQVSGLLQWEQIQRMMKC